MRKVISSLLVLAFVSACASSSAPPRSVRQYIDRALKNAPGEAQPGEIVAAEVGFAKMAREEGQWTAFRYYAAPGAQLHLPNGVENAESWLAGRADPEAAVQWSPRSIWMSCDGAMAVSFGRFRDPAATIGHFVTVWQRQAGGEYRWIYDGGAPDDPQPPTLSNLPEPEEGEIVVPGIDSIAGIVADCPSRDDPVAVAPFAQVPAGIASSHSQSRDGTLRWRWEHLGEGQFRFVTEIWSGGWQTPLDVIFPIEGESGD